MKGLAEEVKMVYLVVAKVVYMMVKRVVKLWSLMGSRWRNEEEEDGGGGVVVGNGGGDGGENDGGICGGDEGEKVKKWVAKKGGKAPMAAVDVCRKWRRKKKRKK